MKRYWLSVVALAMFIGDAYGVEPPYTDNHGIHAVPVPSSTDARQAGKLVIDGKLDDWDLSGEIFLCADLNSVVKDMYNAHVAMMYDATNLYIAVQWRDPVPMGNEHDPRLKEVGEFYQGDCVQLRFITDKISHVSGWFYNVKGHKPTPEPYIIPAIDIQYGKGMTDAWGGGGQRLEQVIGWKLTGGAEMAGVVDAGGRGYVQEIKLPWKLIADAAPGAGKQITCGIDLIWGESNVPAHRYADNLSATAKDHWCLFNQPDIWGPVLLDPRGHLAKAGPLLKGPSPAGPAPVQDVFDFPCAPVGQLIALAVKDGRLVLDRLAWSAGEIPAEDRFREIVNWTPRGETVLNRGKNGKAAFIEADNAVLKTRMENDPSTRRFVLTVEEHTGQRRALTVTDDPKAGFTIQLFTAGKPWVAISSAPDGKAVFTAGDGKPVDAPSFDLLLMQMANHITPELLCPLSKVGLMPPPTPYLPCMMAGATSGFGDPAPEIAAVVDAETAKVTAGADGHPLSAQFQLAVRKMLVAAEAQMPKKETQAGLRGVYSITMNNAWIDVVNALPQVERQGLHENRPYLLAVMANSPYYRANARNRLAQLCGKDYGDDPAAWPK